MFSTFNLCLFTYVYTCLLVFINVYTSYPCLVVFTYVYTCLPLFSVFTYV